MPVSAIELFKTGVDIGDDKLCLPSELNILPTFINGANETIYSAELTIHEGRFHQVKRMFEKVGNKVIYLRRIRMKDLRLDDNLKPGEVRELTEAELSDLKEN